MLGQAGWHRATHKGAVYTRLSARGGLTRSSIAAHQRYGAYQIRSSSLQAGENKTGHINAGENEGIVFFDNVFPLKIQKLFKIPFTSQEKPPTFLNYFISPSLTGTDPKRLIEKASTKRNLPITATETLLRLKEGGAFVKFTHDGSTPASEIEKVLKEYLKEKPIKPWWSPWRRMHVNLVKGRPWVEDLFRLPTPRLKVEFISPEPGAEAVQLSQEELYAFFRPYGKLSDIIMQPSDSKVLPKYALLDFATMGKAISAKNCMHGYLVTEAEGGGKKGTILRLTYEQKIKPHWIRDWIFNHPRIVIPIIAALIAGLTVAVFDPIRTFFVKLHITRSLHLEDNSLYKWIKGYATDIIHWRQKKEDEPGMDAVWDDRKDNIEQIQTWLMETADTFIIVQGPRGSEKRKLVVDQALKDKKHKLIIDCKPIQEARGDSSTIAAAAAQVGYRPVFSWMNSISGMIDMAAQGATGVKTGFSETLDSQLGKIWNNTATALRQIALDGRHKDDKDANLGDDEWLEAHPEERPIVVVDNFLHKSQEGGIVYDKIADWAARLTTNNIAHVVFLTNDVTFSKSLSKALPDRVFRTISLSDCSPQLAREYVMEYLDDSDWGKKPAPTDSSKEKSPKNRADLPELDSCIDLLGGRLTDLEFLARRIKAGETPTKAVSEIIDQSASEILKMYIFGGEEDGSSRRWTPEQAWFLIKQLAANETLRFHETALADTIKASGNGENVLRALEQAELIAIDSGPNGRPASIKPGKPVYQPAFKRLTEDKVLRSRLDLAILAELIKEENKTIEKCENELLLLSQLKGQPGQMVGRANYLLGKLAGAQEKVEGWEREQKGLKGVLGKEY